MRTLGLVLLALRACSGAAPPGDARTVPVADLSDAGTELTYRAFGPDGTFTETIAQNDAASTALEVGAELVRVVPGFAIGSTRITISLGSRRGCS